MLGYGIVAAISLLLGKRTVATLSSGACIAIMIFLSPHISSESMVGNFSSGQTNFRVAHFNVLGSNKQYDAIAERAISSEAAVLSFQELDVNWVNQLVSRLETVYPYYNFVMGKPHGVAVFSKYPLQNVDVYFWYGKPTIVGDILFPNTSSQHQLASLSSVSPIADSTKIHFVATHTLSPRTQDRYQKRNQHLEAVADYLSQIDRPVLVMGDFNIVPWSPTMVEMKEKAHLQDSRKTITPTYPSDFKLGGIPIDYILYSSQLQCIQFNSMETEGSDHRGVIGTYCLKQSTL